MINLEVNKFYTGDKNKAINKYVGSWFNEEVGAILYNFEYLKPQDKVIGYGQTMEQVLQENYKEHIGATVLFGGTNESTRLKNAR